MMAIATSADGTTIGYDRTDTDSGGNRPAVLLVDGAFCSRQFGPMPALVPLLAPHFTVYSYDRRGRGESGDTQPYAPEREIDDIEALIDAAGGSAYVYGISSGAVLAARAAAALPGKVTKLAVYEAPMLTDDSRTPPPADYLDRINRMIDTGRNGDAVSFFMTTMVGAPFFVPYIMRVMPAWKQLKAVAPTLRYDFAVLGDSQLGRGLPAEFAKALGSIDVPTLVADGGKAAPWMRNTADTIAATIPGAERITLPKQTHQVKAAVLAPVLIRHFLGA
jgi:pimeloyl-ACP methyl ester carboxylesterase